MDRRAASHFVMKHVSVSPQSWHAQQVSPESLAALSRVDFSSSDAGEIFQLVTTAVGNLAFCQVEASYRSVGERFVGFPPSQLEHPEFERHLRDSGGVGPVAVKGGRWGWALPLNHRHHVLGCLVLSAVTAPPDNQILLLTILAQQAGAALAYAATLDDNVGDTRRLIMANTGLKETNRELTSSVERLQRQTNMHEVLSAAAGAESGEQGITTALYELTALPVGLEDKFGNLRFWAGPGEPRPYPKQTKDDRNHLLHELAAHNGQARIGSRVLALIQLRTEVLGVLALRDPDNAATEDTLVALRHGARVLAPELAHRRNLAELELNLRRDLVDDLLAGTDRDGAYARADALSHDLRRPHFAVVVQSAAGADSALAIATSRAVSALHLHHLQGRHGDLLVMLTDGRPDPRTLYHLISEALGRADIVIGIGTRCEVPDDLPRSFMEARRALNIRLRSTNPEGAAAFDELGFYRLIAAAHDVGAVEAFVREWLGALLDYDEDRNSELVLTLSDYLECGGNYDESAAALHIHRSTLRYRLARIAELTGRDLRKVDTRFNLHAATRAWRFLGEFDDQHGVLG
ncbi:helix-turn-helix domain-containing protein [Mycobacterium sp. 236(2023)]|uniref:PucR family transcriptional regulator n=1 Tax=Mycobacterium sp. 236(2023) TaxID=3038163 RepID=UPI00241554BA|nr:helix-turn-helix domain-containing protein [Mycobacterium sp. 236(2023)]MDG4667232.1 helix-turn-helix domain-containing protein [Mycobacterium sp. 236(2023)]